MEKSVMYANVFISPRVKIQGLTSGGKTLSNSTHFYAIFMQQGQTSRGGENLIFNFLYP